jgi:hypothetical protein
MPTEFIESKIWSTLGRLAAARGKPAHVAVAYFSKGAADLLPLRKGSRLAVNASEKCVKAGLTSPSDLIQLQKRGVKVYSVANLHAKVYCFESQAFIGSSNASQHSANYLQEAMLRTSDRRVVNAARAFVKNLCIEELGPEQLKRLKKLYRAPKLFGFETTTKGRRKSGKAHVELSRLRIAKLILGSWPEGSESAHESGLAVANSRIENPETHQVDSFKWVNASFRKGDVVVQVLEEASNRVFVSPPGHVVNVKRWSNGHAKCVFIYVEVPIGRRKRVAKLAATLGRGAKKRLLRSGVVKSAFAERLRRAFSK